ncbi:hypothetical protein GE061_005308 [Apolygus lucorum]|uniref:Uncharacterized protein n=1 Tax=Apolygus lucorum TaxID=248454 RepID=A0A6A4IQZ8_APOLU|nr:hypothetical protein GE061_005308 [Apolygus lucorum]
MMIKFGLLLLGLAALCTADRKNVTLSGDKWSWVIENFSGFNLYRRNESWAITTDKDSTITLLCEEISIAKRKGQNCPNGKLVFDDGFKNLTFCGRNENVLIQGNSSQLLVDFVIPPSSGGVFYCKGKSVHPPRNIETIQVAAEREVKSLLVHQQVNTPKRPPAPSMMSSFRFCVEFDHRILLLDINLNSTALPMVPPPIRAIVLHDH